MITCDAHMHTRFSEDSDASVHSMLDAAVNKGMQAVCITDHLDKDFPETPDFPAGFCDRISASDPWTGSVLSWIF